MVVKTMQHLPPPPPPPPIPRPTPSTNQRVIAFTTPENYAGRLSHLLHLKNWTPLWCPTVIIQPTPHNIHPFLSPHSLQNFAAIAFTSRTGITSFSQALTKAEHPPLIPTGPIFTISALGNDAKLLDSSFIAKICVNTDRIRVVIPPVAIPSRMVESLGPGTGRRVMCPVPLVIGLQEPPVVPEFLRDLELNGWVAVRVNAYETRWAGAESVAELVAMSEEEGCGLDAIVFTSTGEVEGMLKGLREWGLDWGMVRKRCPRLVVAAHGPVTAAGAERLGVGVDVVSSRFDSFEGVVDALDCKWQS